LGPGVDLLYANITSVIALSNGVEASFSTLGNIGFTSYFLNMLDVIDPEVSKKYCINTEREHVHDVVAS